MSPGPDRIGPWGEPAMSNLQSHRPSNLGWKIGDVTVTQVVEQPAGFPAHGFFPTSTHEVLTSHAGWLKPWALDDDDNLLISIHALCVESEGRRIVVDTCVGQRPLPGLFQSMSNDGSFLTALADAGFARETVDTVICTHMHFDHVGWNTMLLDGGWVPTFPNARYLLCRDEWEHWNREGASGYAATIDDAVRPVVDAGLADLVASDH